MLQHLQLIKPKKVLQNWLLFAKLQNKTRYNKNIRSLSYWICVVVDIMDGHGSCGGSRSVVIWMCIVSE